MLERTQKIKVGMVFGVFDGLHKGHRFFLTEAAKRCETLIIVVAHPEMVLALKQRLPRHSIEKRMDAIRTFDSACRVVSGDTKPGRWSALKEHRPDAVLLGYDQQTLAQELATIDVVTAFLDSFHPDRYKSSLIHGDVSSTTGPSPGRL